MGIDYETAKWIRKHIRRRRRILTIGRQNWWLSRRESASLGIDGPAWSRTNYSDFFFRKYLECDVVSVDIVDGECPDIIADLSLPRALPSSDFDYVMDFGTAEHVADQGNYWRNLWSSLRVDGVLVGVLPADSLCGHGLYQFSPEFFANMRGFKPLEIALITYGPIIKWEWLSRYDGRFQRRFRWPTFVAFRLLRTAQDFGLPVQYQNATTPTTSERPWAKWLVEIPGVRILERLLR